MATFKFYPGRGEGFTYLVDIRDDWAFAYLPYDDEPLRLTGNPMIGCSSFDGEKLLERIVTTAPNK